MNTPDQRVDAVYCAAIGWPAAAVPSTPAEKLDSVREALREHRRRIERARAAHRG